MCKRAFGNVFAVYLHVKKAAVKWEGEPTFYASSRIARRGFCGRCGTPLSFEYLESDAMDLTVGSLDRPEVMRPVMHVGVESRLPAWHHADGLPEKRIEDFAQIVKRWKDAYGEGTEPGKP
jgi:hypothetical protein